MRQYPRGQSGGRQATTPTPRECTNVVRRMGWVLQKLHETVMSALIAGNEQGLAEEFNDIVKPVVDYMLNVHFTEDTKRAPVQP